MVKFVIRETTPAPEPEPEVELFLTKEGEQIYLKATRKGGNTYYLFRLGTDGSFFRLSSVSPSLGFSMDGSKVKVN